MVRKTERAEKKKGTVMLVNKGAWTAEEDQKLMDYVGRYGDKKWRTLPAKAGLNRCGKSCRLRWLNYLRPGIKRGNISEDEEDLIIRLHNLLGNRWSLIAGRLPGRTDNEIKNHWNTHLSKKSLTINDLNSKIHPKLECSNNNSGSDASLREEPISDLPVFPGKTKLPISDNHDPASSSVAPPMHDRGTRIGDRSRIEEDDDDDDNNNNNNNNVDFETCWHSPSALWFQPFSCEEIYGYDDVTGFLDYKDLFPYFP